MKLAVHNVMFSGASGVNGWIIDFLKLYKPVLYVSRPQYLPRLVHFFYRFRLNPLEYTIVFSAKQLSSVADVLVCFNGLPHLESNKPVKEFQGLKIYHVMDFTFFPSLSNKTLEEGGVDYVFGYARHDRYSDFFQKYYPGYGGKVISVPFGFAPRFKELIPFGQRKNKVIALGSVNSFVDPVHEVEGFQELNEFFLKRGEKFMHKFRRMLVEREASLVNVMDSKLPHFPQVKDFGYDIVQVLNEYRMFVNCESLLYFPSAKTFEGPASGSVLVCSEHPCFSDLGFEDGVNCIKHKEFDMQDFRDKAEYYKNNPEQLEEIQKNGTRFVRENYNYKKVAQGVREAIQNIQNT